MVVIVGYSLWMQRSASRLPPPSRAGGGAASAPAEFRGEAGRAPAVSPRAGRPASSPRAALPKARSQEIVLENESVRAVISGFGGRIVSWRLKGYHATGSTQYEELVPLRAAGLGEREGHPGPLCVRLSDFPDSTAWPTTANLSYMRVGESEIEQRMPGPGGETVFLPALGGAAAEGELVLTQRLPRGRTLLRRLYLPARGYLLRMVVELSGPAPEHLEVMWYPGVGYSPNEEEAMGFQKTYWNAAGAVILNIQDRHRIGEGGKPRAEERPDPFWTAVHNKYFAAVVLPHPVGGSVGVASIKGVVHTDGVLETKGWFDRHAVVPDNILGAVRYHLRPGAEQVRLSASVYIGPQDYRALSELGGRLEKVLDLGWFGFIALPLMQLLEFMHDNIVHNYGVAIIILTVLIKAILWLPSQWGMNQMRKLKELQPQMKFINEQFKDDPRRKQEEMMRLYRDHKVNPVGGCLPILFQLPIFFALYTVLRASVDLRGAPFVLWIHDLSAKDPYYVLPVLVGVTMWLQQSMTPAMGDPAQQKMMKWMTVLFCFIFLNMPSGFMLYFLMQNLTQIGQQLYTNRHPARSSTGGT